MEPPDILALHRACAAGDLNRVEKLVNSGWRVDLKDDNGATPLFAAAFNGRTAIVAFLIGQRADVNEGNEVLYTPLMAACREKKLETVKLLLEAGADPEIVSTAGMRAVHWALMDTIPKGKYQFETETGLMDILSLLKKRGADMNARTGDGTTPLMDAAWWGLTEVTRYLLSIGANKDDKDKEGKTAADYAQQKIEKGLSGDINERCRQIITLLTRGDAGKSWWKFWG